MATATQATKKLRYRIRPRNGWVLVRKLTLDEEITEGGVIVDRSTARSLRAEVVEVPPVSTLSVGQIVIVTAYGMEVEDLEDMTGEKKLMLLRDEEIYTVCEPIED